MKAVLTDQEIAAMAAPLERVLEPLARRGDEAAGRQPVHTVYGGAHLFRAGVAQKFGQLASRALVEYGVDPLTFARAAGIPESQAEPVWQRVAEKLTREPVEDYRIDFEDGYGYRPDDDEDRDADKAGRELAAGHRQKLLPPFVGFRIKPFSPGLTRRALRTLEIVVRTLVEESGGELPGGFVVTLPKVRLPEQTALLADALERLEPRLGLPAGSLRLEFMVETADAILNERGETNLPRIAAAARGRAVAAHFGAYDYTADLEITASEQRLDHPACDFARQMIQLACGGTGLWLSDGATNVLPAPPHRGDSLSQSQREENRAVVHRAWRLHAENVRHALVSGFYQGWDLHPAQLPARYAAVYSFFLAALPEAAARLRSFLAKAGQANLVGDVFDDAATGQGLLNFFIRGLSSGALTESEVLSAGLTLGELHSRSFARIVEARRTAVR